MQLFELGQIFSNCYKLLLRVQTHARDYVAKFNLRHFPIDQGLKHNHNANLKPTLNLTWSPTLLLCLEIKRSWGIKCLDVICPDPWNFKSSILVFLVTTTTIKVTSNRRSHGESFDMSLIRWKGVEFNQVKLCMVTTSSVNGNFYLLRAVLMIIQMSL